MAKAIAAFFSFMAALIQSGKGFLALLIIIVLALGGTTYAGKKYVDVKDADHKNRLSTLEKTQQQVVSTLQTMQITLQNVNENTTNLKKQMGTVNENTAHTQQKVVDIYQQVYEIKLKQISNSN